MDRFGLDGLMMGDGVCVTSPKIEHLSKENATTKLSLFPVCIKNICMNKLTLKQGILKCVFCGEV